MTSRPVKMIVTCAVAAAACLLMTAPVAAAPQTAYVQSTGQPIACGYPADGAILNLVPGPIVLTGRVDALGGVGALSVNGGNVAVDATGAFAVSINAQWGVNFVELALDDGAGRKTQRTCTFLLSSAWTAEDKVLHNAVTFRAEQGAIGDGFLSGSVNSFNDVLYAVINARGVGDALHNALNAGNPLKPLSCDDKLLSRTCLRTSQVTYVSSTLSEPNTVSLTAGPGSFASSTRFANVVVRLRISGQVGGVPYDTAGNVTFDYFDTRVTYDVALVNGRPRISVRPGSLSAVAGTPAIAFRLDAAATNEVIAVVNGVVRDVVRNTLSGYVSNNYTSALDGLFASFEVTTLSPTFAIPRLDAGTLTVAFGQELSSLNATSLRLLIGVGTRFASTHAHTRPSLGAPMPSHTAAVDPPGGRPIAISVYDGVFDQAMHSLWRAGYFDVVLGSGALSGAIPAGAAVRTTAALPPAIRLRSDGRLEIALGGVAVHLDYPAVLTSGLDATIGGRVSCALRLVGDDANPENCAVEEFHLSPTASVDAAAAAAIEPLLRGVLAAMLAQSATNTLPALPLPGFRLPASLANFGLPATGVLGPVTPIFMPVNRHVVIFGGFGVR